ncbi:hypothetical protein [Undibacterium sp. Ji22W]|uniref:hypothetical protein n=1 Tax=Undibacterium sp. Ji22W TaxID=3413038 RepID=UPI003BF1B7A1
MTKIKTTLAGLALCIGSLFIFFGGKDDDLQPSPQVMVNQVASSEVNKAAVDATTTLQPASTLSSLAKMGQDYSTSRNARSFVANAKLRPDLGGYTFAGQILAECDVIGINRYRELRYLPKESQADFAKRSQVAQFWYQRCQGLLDSEANVLATVDLHKEALKNNDALAQLSERIDKAIANKNRVEVRAALQQLLAMKPPLIMGHALYSIARSEAAFYQDRGTHETGMWFDGKVRLDAEEQFYYFALDLLSCSFGNICDQYDTYVVDACLAGGGCYPDRFTYIRNVTMARTFAKYPEAAEKMYQSLLAMHQRLVAAIERGDVDAFMRP